MIILVCPFLRHKKYIQKGMIQSLKKRTQKHSKQPKKMTIHWKGSLGISETWAGSAYQIVRLESQRRFFIFNWEVSWHFNSGQSTPLFQPYMPLLLQVVLEHLSLIYLLTRG